MHNQHQKRDFFPLYALMTLIAFAVLGALFNLLNIAGEALTKTKESNEV